MNANIIVKESPIQGLGVFTLIDIPKGHPILKIDDTRQVTEENPLRESAGEYERHCDYLAGGKVVLMQSPERHINHSCSPNTFVKTIGGIRYVFALRDIPAGEEITYDYCINGFGDTLWQCNCGSPRCRKEIHSDFFHLPLELQLEYLPLLDDWYLAEYQAKVGALLESAGLSV
jgi:SET domain-containing protein